ncbi:MAG: PEGA domain-containing protein [Deltaproteobacteria bacterium]|nr:PEGA domain-containing protein [Deltaproteobacteria bacterium]
MSLRATSRWVVSLAAVLLCTGTAAADAVYLVPVDAVGGDPSIPEALRGEGHEALRGALVEGHALVDDASAETRLPEEIARCGRGECARQAAELVGADIGVVLSIWERSNGPVFEVTLVETGGASYRGSSEPGGTVRQALEAAFARRALGAGPWLSVRGTPAGAQFVVAGEPRGFVPDRVVLAPGVYQVTVRAEGYVSAHREVTIGERADDEAVLEVALEREGGPGTSGGGANLVGFLGGGALAAAGAVAVGVGVGTLMGETSEAVVDGEVFVTRPDATAGAVWVSVGAAALAGGIVWLVLALASDAGGGDDAPSVSAAPGGIALHY